MEHALEFGATVPSQEERAALLEEAAAAFDRRSGKLGPRDRAPETVEGHLARMFAEDHAALGRPQVFRLAPEGLDAESDGVPVAIEELTRHHAHYWMEFPVSLWTKANRGFNQLEVRVAFNEDDEDDGTRPIAVDAVPDHALVTRFEASGQASLGVNANFAFAIPQVPLDGLGIPVTAEAGAEAGASAKMIFAPRPYTLRAAVVTRSGTGLNYVFWRLEKDAFLQENDPGLRVVLRVPLPAERLQVKAEMLALRHANLFGAGFKKAITDLPDYLRDLFNGGTPIGASESWDLSDKL